jgi:hypothetical protein
MKIEHTSTGRERILFEDRDGEKCYLQQSSVAELEPRGTPAVWFGVVGRAMHIGPEQMRELVAHLQCWVENRTFGGPIELDTLLPAAALTPASVQQRDMPRLNHLVDSDGVRPACHRHGVGLVLTDMLAEVTCFACRNSKRFKAEAERGKPAAEPAIALAFDAAPVPRNGTYVAGDRVKYWVNRRASETGADGYGGGWRKEYREGIVLRVNRWTMRVRALPGLEEERIYYRQTMAEPEGSP